jgi:hypothetical protein
MSFPAQAGATLPDEPSLVVPRDEAVAAIARSFGADSRVTYVRWPTGAGKTTLLSQFARAHRETTVAYFVGADLWSSQPQLFTFDVCQQLLSFLGNDPLPLDLSYDRVMQLFPRLWDQFAKAAKASDLPHYLVVDALDQARPDSSGQSIHDVLPRLGRNVFMLASGAAVTPPLLANQRPTVLEDLPLFGELHTAHLLSGLGLSETQIAEAHRATGGVPAYVAEVRRRLLSQGTTVEALLDGLPGDLTALLEREWRSFSRSEQLRSGLAILIFAPEPLSITEWAQIARIDIQQAADLVRQLPFIRVNVDKGTIEFLSGLHRQFLSSKLLPDAAESQVRLVEFYQSNPNSLRSLRVLPGLLHETRDFETLKSLVDATYLTGVLSRSRDLSLVRRHVDAAFEAARSTQDLAAAVFQVSAESLVLSTYERFAHLQPELSALCSLGDFREAVDLAERAMLPEDQLQALGVVGQAMKEAGQALPENLLGTVDVLSGQIPATTPLDTATSIATRIFAVRPEQSIALVERCAGEAGTLALERALLQLALGAPKHSPADAIELISKRLTSVSSREALTSGTRVSGLTADQLIEALSRVERASSAFALVRGWCNVNRSNPDAAVVVAWAMDLIERRTEFAPSARQVRQVVEPLVACEAEVVRPLVDRLSGLRPGLPDRPWIENIRLDLLLAQVQAKWDVDGSRTQLGLAEAAIRRAEGLEARCLAQAHLCRTISTLATSDPALRPAFREAVAVLEEDFRALLAQSADHYQIARPILTAVARFDPAFAALFALELNYPERRDRLLSEILDTAVSRGPAPFDVKWALDLVDVIEAREEIAGPAVIGLCQQAAEQKFEIEPPLFGRLSSCVEGLPDPADRALAFAWLGRWAATAHDVDPDPLGSQLMLNARNSALEVDEPWKRRHMLLDVCATVKASSEVLARECLVLARAQGAGVTSDPYFGPLYATSLLTACLSFPIRGQGGVESQVRLLRDRIALCPSTWIQVDLLGTLASRLYLRGERALANDIAGEMLTRLRTIRDAYARRMAIARQFEALAEHDLEAAVELLDDLPEDWRESVVIRLVGAKLTGKPTDIPLRLDAIEWQADQDSLVAAARVVELAKRDWSLVGSMRLISNAAVPALGAGRVAGRTVSRLAERFDELSAQRLPDSRGIGHDGFLLLARAHARRLRSALKKSADRSGDQDWETLTQAIDALPNAADSALVFSLLASDFAGDLPKLASRFVDHAAARTPDIPAMHDRVSRLDALAGGYVALGNLAAAKTAVATAFQAATDLQSDDSETVLDRIVDLAESIDPEMASELANAVEDHVRRYSVEERRTINTARRRPSSILELVGSSSFSEFPVGEAGHSMRVSLASGRLGAQSRSVVSDWLKMLHGTSYFEATPVLIWVSENAEAGAWGWDERMRIHEAYRASSDFALSLGETVAMTLEHDGSVDAVSAAGLSVYRAGEFDRVREEIAKRLASAVGPSLLWVDPYFRPDQVELLVHVPDGVAVRIVADESEQKDAFGKRIPREEIARAYELAWRRRFDVAPPHTTVFLLGTNTVGAPIHDRYLLSSTGGIWFGGSANAFGTKDTSWTDMSPEQCAVQESEITRWIVAATPFYRDEAVRVTSFTLGG